MIRVLNEKIKKGQNVSLSGNNGNQSSNTIAKLENSLNLWNKMTSEHKCADIG